jgi:cell division protein ZapA (FtsZ GTPase activity inhibitor)
MAAINLSHQLLKAESENVQISTGARDQLSRMDHKIQNALLRFSPADA